MLTFDPNDPFPLVAQDSCTYAEAQLHAAHVDAWLGLRTEQIEDRLIAQSQADLQQQRWIGLPVKSLLTPYTEIRTILSKLDPTPGETIIDLGAAYGRMGYVIGRHYPEIHFVGYELVRERVDEANRCLTHLRHPLIQMKVADLKSVSFHPEPAEYYFIYDFGTRDSIQKSLIDLKSIARSRAITVVGRGRACRDLIEQNHPWLSQVQAPEHFAHFSVYRSR
jgi:hypothetical protein